MKRTVLAAVAAIALSATAYTAESGKVIGSMEIGNWTVMAVAGELSGTFSHCAAFAVWDGSRQARAKSITMNVKMFSNGLVGFGIGGEGWKLREGKTYTVDLLFDGKAPWKADMVAQNEGAMAVIGSLDKDTQGWFGAMMFAHRMDISIAGRNIGGFTLQGSAKALDKLMDCAIANAPAPDPSFGGGEDEKPAKKQGYDVTDETF